ARKTRTLAVMTQWQAGHDSAAPPPPPPSSSQRQRWRQGMSTTDAGRPRHTRYAARSGLTRSASTKADSASSADSPPLAGVGVAAACWSRAWRAAAVAWLAMALACHAIDSVRRRVRRSSSSALRRIATSTAASHSLATPNKER
ncbi:hypothetical protein B296_00053592, partial [Ensete ventricosum]